MTTDVNAFIKHIKVCKIDLPNARLSKEYYYASLPLCVIDAVFSIGVRYESTQKTVKNWCSAFQWRLFKEDSDHPTNQTIDEFIKILEKESFEYLAQNTFKNRQRTSTRNGILKTEAVYTFSKILQEFNIQKHGDTLDHINNIAVEQKIREIKGQKSGISFSYFLMLSGSDDFVKNDRMIQRFTLDALSRPVISSEEIQLLFQKTCKELQRDYPHITPRLLDYEIWKYQRSASDRLNRSASSAPIAGRRA